MQQASAIRTVHASPAEVWAIVSDVSSVVRWHPSVATADLLSASATGMGATRRCNFYDGSSVREEVCELEEGGRVRLRLSEYSAPMKKLEAEFRLAPGADGQTEVTFELFYEVKWGLVGQLMGATMVKKELTGVATKVLAGLGHHVATGELVGQDFKPAAA